MAASFAKFWPSEIGLTIYAQDFTAENTVDLYQEAPWLAPWKAQRSPEDRGKHLIPRQRFKRDAVRFSHKVAALGAGLEAADCDVLIWLDADVLTYAPVTVDWLDSLFPPPAPMAWLDRTKKYAETSFMMFRLPDGGDVIRRVVAMYQGETVFGLAETHDGFVFQHVVDTGEIGAHSLSGEGRKWHNAFVNSPLATRMDHLKRRKGEDRTPRDVRVEPGGGRYWNG